MPDMTTDTGFITGVDFVYIFTEDLARGRGLLRRNA